MVTESCLIAPVAPEFTPIGVVVTGSIWINFSIPEQKELLNETPDS